MKLYSVAFEQEQPYLTIKQVARAADPKAIVTLNEGSNNKIFELQSEKAAQALVDQLGGSLTVIDYDVSAIYK